MKKAVLAPEVKATPFDWLSHIKGKEIERWLNNKIPSAFLERSIGKYIDYQQKYRIRRTGN